MKTTVGLYAGIRFFALRTFTFLLLVMLGSNGVWASFTCVNTTPMFSGFADTSFCNAEGIEAGDFNNDGKIDLIGAIGSGGVCVALGNGAGGFAAPSTTTLGSASGLQRIVVGDFNADGNLDFAVSGGSNIAVGGGNGSGGFSSIAYHAVGDVGGPDSAWGITTGDFDNDGDTDLATANGSSISIFDNVHGAFSKRVPNVTAGGGGYGIGSADFDSDGKKDLFITRNGNPGTVMYNNYPGSPGWTAYTPLGNESTWFISCATGDFDQDGNKDDLVSGGSYNGGGKIEVLTGNTNRTMTSSQSTGIGQYLGGGIRTGDFNADSKTDIALASGYYTVGSTSLANFIHYELNQGAGVFGDGTSINLGSSHATSDIAVGDLNLDGKPEGALGAGPTAASVTINHYNENATRKTDYNGDGRSDYAVWRPSNRIWYNWHSYFNTQTYDSYGLSSDIPVPGDYDGDKKTDMAVLRPGVTNVWYITYSSDLSTHNTQWGSSNDYLTPADFDGDGKTDIAVWRPSNGVWYILKSSNGATEYRTFGANGDKPVQGDYDADGAADAAVFRPSDQTWYVLKTTTGGTQQGQWGLTNDNPVPGDYDGDCKNDYAVWRQSDQTWYIFKSSNGGTITEQFGNSTNVPQPADFDGDGKTDLAMWTQSSGVWAIKTSSHGTLGLSWGASSDTPTTSLFPFTNVIP